MTQHFSLNFYGAWETSARTVSSLGRELLNNASLLRPPSDGRRVYISLNSNSHLSAAERLQNCTFISQEEKNLMEQVELCILFVYEGDAGGLVLVLIDLLYSKYINNEAAPHHFFV